jgi:CubicO group peptidase (beta-lactamase class C family)
LKGANVPGRYIRTLFLIASPAVAPSSSAGRPQATRESHFSVSEIEKVDEFLKTRTSPSRFSGTVLVAIDGHVVLNGGYDFADAELEVPNAPTTIFSIGSLTKTLTAAAVLKVVEKHQLSLDDSICRYLKTCPADWSPVRIRHLLAQVSGIPDLFNAIPAADEWPVATAA